MVIVVVKVSQQENPISFTSVEEYRGGKFSRKGLVM